MSSQMIDAYNFINAGWFLCWMTSWIKVEATHDNSTYIGYGNSIIIKIKLSDSI